MIFVKLVFFILLVPNYQLLPNLDLPSTCTFPPYIYPSFIFFLQREEDAALEQYRNVDEEASYTNAPLMKAFQNFSKAQYKVVILTTLMTQNNFNIADGEPYRDKTLYYAYLTSSTLLGTGSSVHPLTRQSRYRYFFFNSFLFSVKLSTISRNFIFSNISGNMYTASLYAGLVSLVSEVNSLEAKRILLYSYGSGLCSSMFSVVGSTSPAGNRQPPVFILSKKAFKIFLFS